MLKLNLLHPEILSVLGSNGHGARVLIADGNFPFMTGTPGHARKVFLNLSPGMLTVTDVLSVIKDYIPVESAIIMSPPDESEQLIYRQFQEILGAGIDFKKEKRTGFYFETKSEDTCLVIATGETRRYANILLIIGS